MNLELSTFGIADGNGEYFPTVVVCAELYYLNKFLLI